PAAAEQRLAAAVLDAAPGPRSAAGLRRPAACPGGPGAGRGGAAQVPQAGLRATPDPALRPAARSRPGAPAADRRGPAQAAPAGPATAPCPGPPVPAEPPVGQGPRVLRDQPGLRPQPGDLRRAGAPAGQPGRGRAEQS